MFNLGVAHDEDKVKIFALSSELLPIQEINCFQVPGKFYQVLIA